MEEPEVPTEHLHEHLHEQAHGAKKNWITWVALSSAILAGLAAVTALLAGHHANEAMVEQIKSSDQWSYYQAKGVKGNVLASKVELLQALGKPADERDAKKLADYKHDQEEISRDAREKEAEARHHLESHVIFARGVTLFQVAIAIGAISALTHRRRYWTLSLIFGAVGVFFLVQGILYSSQKPAHPEAPAETSSPPAKSR
jgi:hypothetical protein